MTDALHDRCGYFCFENAKELKPRKSAPPCTNIIELLADLKKGIGKDGSIQNRFHLMNSIDKFIEEINN